MKTGQEMVMDLTEQLTTMKLPLMAMRLDELYRSPVSVKPSRVCTGCSKSARIDES